MLLRAPQRRSPHSSGTTVRMPLVLLGWLRSQRSCCLCPPLPCKACTWPPLPLPRPPVQSTSCLWLGCLWAPTDLGATWGFIFISAVPPQLQEAAPAFLSMGPPSCPPSPWDLQPLLPVVSPDLALDTL